MSLTELREAVLRLSEADRAQLVDELLASFETSDASDQAEVDAALAEESEQRIDAIEAGEMQLIPADEVLRNLKARVR